MADKGCLYPGKAPYAGHVQFRSDKTTSEYGTGTDAGRSKVTEGRKPNLRTKGKSNSSHGERGYKEAKVKHL